MSYTRHTLSFAFCMFFGYLAGVAIADHFSPTHLFMILAPVYVRGAIFAFFVMPLAVINAELVQYFERRTSIRASAVTLILVSTGLVLPFIAGFIWLENLNLYYSIGDLSNVAGVPESDAYTLSNARLSFAIKHSVTFLTAAWGSTAVYLNRRAETQTAGP